MRKISVLPFGAKEWNRRDCVLPKKDSSRGIVEKKDVRLLRDSTIPVGAEYQSRHEIGMRIEWRRSEDRCRQPPITKKRRNGEHSHRCAISEHAIHPFKTFDFPLSVQRFRPEIDLRLYRRFPMPSKFRARGPLR
jgi:hypothetical protein